MSDELRERIEDKLMDLTDACPVPEGYIDELINMIRGPFAIGDIVVSIDDPECEMEVQHTVDGDDFIGNCGWMYPCSKFKLKEEK